MKVGLVGILQNPSVRMSSHNAGWTHVYLSMLQAKHDDVEVINDSFNWNEYDVIYINEGVNFKEGVWNLFGGVSDKLIKKLAQLKQVIQIKYELGPKLNINFQFKTKFLN